MKKRLRVYVQNVPVCIGTTRTYSFPVRGLSCLHWYQEWNIQPLWKVKGLEQYTSWKVRVPDCVFFFVRNEQKIDTDMYMNMHMYM